MWILIVRSPDNEPKEYALLPRRYSLGRSGENDIVIMDESASRWHAEIDTRENSILIRDLGSTNGTYVNHQRIFETRALRKGDQVRIGSHLLVLEWKEDQRSTPDSRGPDTQPFTRELLLDSVDQSAILLHEIANRLTTILDLTEALKEIADFLKIAIGAERSQVILEEQFERTGELGFSTSIANQAIKKKAVVFIPDSRAQSPLSESANMLSIRSAICVPVLIGSKIVAIIYAYKTEKSTRLFDQNDLHLVVAVSHQAALTIQRSKILERANELEYWAFTDSLTGINNRRQILKFAEFEYERSKRFKRPLSVMMIDVDNFKQANDTYGHIVGDQILKEIAKRCKANIRNVDVIGRYGGDEFLVLVIEAGLGEGHMIAKRLREKVSQTPVQTEKGLVQTSISIGLATLTDECPDLKTLLTQADDALLLAKKTGKNHVKTSRSGKT